MSLAPRMTVVLATLLLSSCSGGGGGGGELRGASRAKGYRPLIDVNQSSEAKSSHPREYATLAGMTLFDAYDDDAGCELWISDGFQRGTRRLQDINPGLPGSDPTYFYEFQGRLFFSATTAESGRELWMTDGTGKGTVPVADIAPGQRSSFPQRFIRSQGLLCFVANDGQSGNELWATDGTWTQQVSDLNPGPSSSNPNGLTSFNGALYFRASDDVVSHGLYRFDGSAVQLIHDLSNGGYVNWSGMAVHDGLLYMVANEPATGQELWSSDGTKAGTRRVFDLYEGRLGSTPTELLAWNDRLVFIARTPGGGRELWAYGTNLAELTVRPGALDSRPYSLTVAGGDLYFAADDGTTGRELWATDGTLAGTRLVTDLNPGIESSVPTEMTAYDGRLYFSTDDGSTGREVWSSQGDSASTEILMDLVPGPEGSGLGGHRIAESAGMLWFVAETDAGREPWISDGTPQGTELVADLNPIVGTDSSYPDSFTEIGERMYFRAWSRETGNELYVSDLTDPGTHRVRDIWPGPESGFFRGGHDRLVEHQGTLFFAAEDSETGKELWKSDGTEQGTTLVIDLEPGEASSQPDFLISFKNHLYFVAERSDEAWLVRTDGSASGTEDHDGPIRDSGDTLVEFQDELYYWKDDSGRELWATDGSSQRLIFRDGNKSGSGQLRVAGDRLYFSAYDSATGQELWSTDGTPEGTALVADIEPGAEGSNPRIEDAQGDHLYFMASTETSGRELWQTDGTASGTVLVHESEPGPDSGNYNTVDAAGGGLFYSIQTQGDTQTWFLDREGNGVRLEGVGETYEFIDHRGWVYFLHETQRLVELWRSDATSAGTRRLPGALPGKASSDLYELTVVGGRLIFASSHPTLGYEIFTYQL